MYLSFVFHSATRHCIVRLLTDGFILPHLLCVPSLCSGFRVILILVRCLSSSDFCLVQPALPYAVPFTVLCLEVVFGYMFAGVSVSVCALGCVYVLKFCLS